MGDNMAIVGFNFTKMSAERKHVQEKGKIEIKNNVSIIDVQESKVSLGSPAQKVAEITFDFSALYEPKMGSIKFSGEVLYLGETKTIDTFVENWTKTKKLPAEAMAAVMNNILNKCNIQALILSQQVNLPPPIKLPRVEAKKEA